MMRIWEAVSFRLRRARIAWTSRYWAAFVRRRGGSIGAGLIARERVLLDIGQGAKIDFGRGVTLAEGVSIHVGAGAALVIGDGCFIGRDSVIACNQRLEIGVGTQIAHRVTLIDTDHRFDAPETPLTDQGSVSSAIQVGREVWIGAHAVVLKGVTIGDHAVVGAAAVVTRDVPARAVAVGNPAHARSKS